MTSTLDTADRSLDGRRDAAAQASLQNRLAELELIEDGWYDGQGQAPSKTALENAAQTLEALLDLGAPSARLYPDIDGSIRAEWALSSLALSVDFSSAKGMYIHSTDTSGDTDQHYYTSRSDPSGTVEALLSMGLKNETDDTETLIRRWSRAYDQFGATTPATSSSPYHEISRRYQEGDQVVEIALKLLNKEPTLVLLALLDDICDASPAAEITSLEPAAQAWINWGREQGLLTTDPTPERKFAELADQLENEALGLSSTRRMIDHPVFIGIQELGRPALTGSLQRLASSANRPLWLRVLGELTGRTPGAGQDDIDKSAAAWIDWGREQQLILSELEEDQDVARITEILDSIPDAWERTQASIAQVKSGETVPLSDLDGACH